MTAMSLQDRSAPSRIPQTTKKGRRRSASPVVVWFASVVVSHPACLSASAFVSQRHVGLVGTVFRERQDTGMTGVTTTDWSYSPRTQCYMLTQDPEQASGNVAWTPSDDFETTMPPPQSIETSHELAVAIDAYGKDGNPQAAETLFQKWTPSREPLPTDSTVPSIVPNRACYSALLHAHARAGNLPRSLELLQEMEETPLEQHAQPTTSEYNLVLGLYAREGLDSSPQKAETLLKHMVDRCKLKEQQVQQQKPVDNYTQPVSYESSTQTPKLHMNTNHDSVCECAPDLQTYNLVLECHSRSGRTGSGDRAMEILEALKKQYDDGEFSFRPDSRTYSIVMQALLRHHSSRESIIPKLIELLKEAKDVGLTNADAYLYTSVLDAYASAGAAEDAEVLLDEMENEGIANDVAYNIVMKAWKAHSNLELACERATMILKRMEDRKCADKIGYTTMVGLLAKKGDTKSAETANNLLNRMLKEYEKGNEAVKPNVKTYNSVLHAWVRCLNVQRAEQVLNDMEQMLEEEQSDLVPNVVSYSTVMSGWAKSNEKFALEKVEAIFDRMVAMSKLGYNDAAPNMFSYVTLINAYARHGTAHSAQKANDVLHEMYRKYKDGEQGLKPNAQVVSVVIDSWQRSGSREAGEKAEQLLNWSLKIFEEEGEDPDLQPNEYTFASTIAAWGKSRKLDKASRASNLLNRMIELYESHKISARPNTHCFTAVINCCAYCEKDDVEKSVALRTAISAYKQLCASEYGKPNEVTFSSLLTALRNLLPLSQERSSAAKTIFVSAAKEGLVSKLVVERLQSVLPYNDFHAVIPKDAITKDERILVDRLPSEWKRNVMSTKRHKSLS